jgi:hypothetical protein
MAAMANGLPRVSCRVFNVVTAYEDCTDGLRAKEMLNRLAARLGSDFSVASDLWGFDTLGLPAFNEMADTAATAADMIILCAENRSELPDHVQDWIEKWLPKQWGGLLVALLHTEQEEAHQPARVYARLKQLAEQANIDFFCQTDCWKQSGQTCTMEALLRQAEARSALLESLLQGRSRAWEEQP